MTCPAPGPATSRPARWRRAGAAAVGALALAAPGTPASAVEVFPDPPPVRVDPPPGRTPDAVRGLRQAQECAPPPADPADGGPGTGPERLRLTEVHRLATGAGVLIAMIDTGVAPHPRLGDRLRGGGDYLTGADGLDDCDGHGTAVAGLLAAEPEPGPDGRGGVPIGIAPGAELLSIRQSSPSFTVPGPGDTEFPAGDVATLADAIVLAVREDAQVVNVSEAACLAPERAAVEGVALHAALRFALESDVVVVAAAGNLGRGGCGPGLVALPGWYDADVLTVGAVDPLDAPAEFTVPGPWVDVAAPGTALRSLAVGGGTTTTGTDGTSFATPYVAGLAALVRERFPALTAPQVIDRILATARRPAGDRDGALGHGVIDPIAALTAVPDVLTPDSLASPRLAELPGTAPRPAGTAAARRPTELLAVGAFLIASALAAWRLRRRLGSR